MKKIVFLIFIVFLPLTSIAEMTESLKKIKYRDAVEFQIPSNWTYEDEPGIQGTFYLDKADTGTLRVSVFEFESETEEERNNRLGNLFQSSNPETLAQGVYLKTEILEGKESGEKLLFYKWIVALALPDNLIRLVIYTHTIVEGQENESFIKNELEMVNESVRTAWYSFSTNLKAVDNP
jgi:hypothetical protein